MSSSPSASCFTNDLTKALIHAGFRFLEAPRILITDAEFVAEGFLPRPPFSRPFRLNYTCTPQFTHDGLKSYIFSVVRHFVQYSPSRVVSRLSVEWYTPPWLQGRQRVGLVFYLADHLVCKL